MAKRQKNGNYLCTKGPAMIHAVTTFFQENKNLIYIAIIGTCLTITVLYKLGQFFGVWAV
ncbi:MAG: hypothetical protein WAK75_01860 [Methanoregula sp.]|uniref:hypothetical protein n=1 Tax=Methanoregula sp. TaxID=2052170 RepID=UPI003BB0CCD5